MKLRHVWDAATALSFADWIEDPACGMLLVEKLNTYVRASKEMRRRAKNAIRPESDELIAAARIFDACASRTAEELSTIGERGEER